MSGTRLGGLKSRDKILKRYGKDHYINMGRKGGLKNNGHLGFGSLEIGKDGLTGRQRAKIAGRKGGLNRRGYRKYA